MKELSQDCGRDLLYEPQSIITKIRVLVEKYPNELAISCPHQPADLYGCKSLPIKSSTDQSAPSYLRWSYQTLDQGVNKIKQGLMALGSVKGTLLFLFCENQVESVIFTLVAYSLGWIHVPIGPEYLRNAQEIQYMITSIMTSLEASNAVFFVNNEETAQKLDQLDAVGEHLKVCCGRCPNTWISFDSLMKNSDPPSDPYQVGAASNERSVFFTSGTTSLPKACFIEPNQWFHGLESSLTLGSLELGDFVSVAAPIYHAFGFICTMMPLLRGAGTVLVGPKFSPRGMIRALVDENCTHAALVPTMFFGIEQMVEDEDLEVHSLRGLICAGMTMTPDIARRCKQVLGASTIENFYGMTEGVFVSTGPVEDLCSTVLQGTLSTGRPIPGGHVRVCVFGGRSPVPTGVTGVLHFSGTTMIKRYLNCESPDFYESDGKLWFVTGDCAVMDDNKQLYIVGREKDIIVCGGQNIAPSKIEHFLAQTPQFQALEPYVVASEDVIAGEVPIAVIRFAAGHDVENRMRDTIRENLGAQYVPRAFITLQSLGLHEIPRTPAGKIRKEELKRHVTEFRRPQSFNIVSVPNSFEKLTQIVLTVWSRLLGIQASHLDIKAPISQLADSILMLSARARIKSETGRSVSLSQWLTIKTIDDQIKTLSALESEKRLNDFTGSPKCSNPRPLEVNDIFYLGEDESAFHTTKEVIERSIIAQGLSWEDVQNVFPCTDFIQILCRSQVINTWNIRTTILSKTANVEGMQRALRATLRNHPLMLSYITIDDKALGKELGLYVVLQPTKKIIDQCILSYGAVDHVHDLRNITMNYPFEDHGMLPGPLFRCLVIFVRETNSAAVITNVSHAVLDATYHSLFHEDLDLALDGNHLRSHTSFKAWAETYHMLRKSPMANSMVRFYTQYLKFFKDHEKILWPHSTSRLIVSPERAAQDGHILVFGAPSFIRLRQKYPKLTTPVVLKAALALMIFLHTNHTHALFLNLEAQRSRFPFFQENCPFENPMEAADVAGPTFSGVLNLITFDPAETVLEYLTRIQRDQENLSKHANVPWHELSRYIGYSMEDVLPTVAESTIFNWMPGLGPSVLGENLYKNITVTQTHIRTKLGMLASAGAGGADGSEIVIFLQGALANISSLWVDRVAQEWKAIALWLAEEQSLLVPVGNFTTAISVEPVKEMVLPTLE